MNVKAELSIYNMTRQICDSLSGFVVLINIRELYMGTTVKGRCQACLPAHSLKDILRNSCDRKHELQKGNTVFGVIWLMAFNSWGEQC